MNPESKDRSKALMFMGLGGFAIVIIPLLALVFFSPGLRSEGAWGRLAFAAGLLSELALLISARRTRALWILVLFLGLVLLGVIYQTLADAPLYIGT